MSFLLVVLPSLPTILQEIILITKVKTSDRDSFDNQLATVAGWGLLEENGAWPDPFEPREVELTVRPVSVCPGFKSDGVTELSPSDICAAVDGGGKDSCQVSLQLSQG